MNKLTLVIVVVVGVILANIVSKKFLTNVV